MKVKGCKDVNLAYWANQRPVSMLKLIRPADTVFRPHTVAAITIDGQKVNAMFDTGADESLIAASVAKRLGVTAASDGVTDEGVSGGLGTRHVRTYRATFKQIEVGGELLKGPKIQFADMGMSVYWPGEEEEAVATDLLRSLSRAADRTVPEDYVFSEGGTTKTAQMAGILATLSTRYG